MMVVMIVVARIATLLCTQRLAPFLASRARVRDRFRSTMRRHGSLGVLASETLDELFFHSGDVFKERNDGA